MKQFEWRTFDELISNADTDYINDCCEFGDVVLEKIKSGFQKQQGINSDNAYVMQEDWGWLLELNEHDILYEIAVNYTGQDDEKAHGFNVVFEAKNLKKGFFFTRKTEAEDECIKFSEIVNQIAADNNFVIAKL